MTTSTDGLPPTYQLADLTLDAARRCVLREGRPIDLKALDFDLLRFLVESAPNMVAYWQEYGWPPFCRPLDEHDFEC